MQKVVKIATATLLAAPMLFVGAQAFAASTTTSTTTAKVTIAKYLNGVPATASSTGSASFPMTAVWRADNLSAGATSSGSFSLSATGYNNPNAYQATTAGMNLGAYYGVSEGTQNTCSATYPFTLAGYTTGASLAAAAAASLSTTTPSFTNLQNDEYVIVWNKTCAPAPMPLSPTNGASLTKSQFTQAAWSAVSDPATPISYYFESSNASTTNSTGGFSNPAYQSGALSTTSLATANTAPGTYYWHVRAKDNSGNYSPWSSIFSVTVTGNATSTPTTTPTTTAQVHIAKYFNGAPATASSTGSASFPMTSTWRAANLNGDATSTGSYSLSATGYNDPTPYHASTVAMDSGAYYATAEVTGASVGDVLPIGASCANGQTQLVGYTSSPTSFADAAGKSVATTAPSFSNLTKDEYVIVWNKACGATTTPGTGALKVMKYSIGGAGTFSFTGSNGIGSFSITTKGDNGFGFFNSGSDTISGLSAGTYNISEATSSDWRAVGNSCSQVTVRNNATSTCVVVNLKERNTGGAGSISGEVFNDTNGNGRLDSGEAGLSGWTVTLVPGNGGQRQTVTSDASGDYTFSNLNPGWYWLWGPFKSGWIGTSWPNAIYLAAGQSSSGNNFGERQFTNNWPWWSNGLHLGQENNDD